MSWLADAQAAVEQHKLVEVAHGVLLDPQTANMLVLVHGSLSPENQAKFESMDLLTAVKVGWAMVK